MGFFLFLLVNATLFIRPAEIVPDLVGLPIYNILILGCFACSFPKVLRQLRVDSLVKTPITVCVLGVLGAVVLSHLSHLRLFDARESGVLFIKVVLYYLLLVGLVDSLARMRRFLYWLGWMIFVLTAVALLQYHEFINLPSLESLSQAQYDRAGNQLESVIRLCSTGIYDNPNSLARILVTGMMLSLYWAGDRRLGITRVIWLMPVVIEGYALSQTHSRGGFMALMTSLLCMTYARFGARWTIVLSSLALPLLLALKGRQTDISLSEGTGHQRLEIWAEGWSLFKRSPLFGVGMNQFVEEIHYVAHNSFFHCFPELGFLGGTFFAGMFFHAIWGPLKLGLPGSPVRAPELRRLGCFLAAITAGEAVGQLSITRSYEVSTYLLIGLAAAYLRLVAADPSVSVPRLEVRLVRQVFLVSLSLLFFLYMLMKL